MKPITAIGLALGAAFIWKLLSKQKSVGKMSDPAPTLENLKRGIANGWYTTEITTVDGKPAVRLSGKLTDGTYYQDIYPISTQVANELRMMGVKVAQ